MQFSNTPVFITYANQDYDVTIMRTFDDNTVQMFGKNDQPSRL